ncbi:retrovirus-related Pol polyprotein from transposon opus [Trichonephila clavipes]|nr:retrovirus-related Pol polyprotein from transposon opus [Trichonephila clavipes]
MEVLIKEEDLVRNLGGLMQLEMANLIDRKPEENANNYEHIKAEYTWRDFGFELTNYFNEYIWGIKIYDFDSLKQLVIVDQMKDQAELKEVDIGLVKNGYITPVIKTVVATVDGLNAGILVDTETYEELLEQEKIYNPRFTAAMNLRSYPQKKKLVDKSVNTEEEEKEPTIIEYDEEKGNNTEKFKILFKKHGIVLSEIKEDILYHEELLCGNKIKQLVIPEIRKRKICT